MTTTLDWTPTPENPRAPYSDDELPGYLVKLRREGSRESAITAKMYGAELRTRQIARERLFALEHAPR